MKKHFSYLFSLLTLGLVACTPIDEQERLIEVVPQHTTRAILLEEFTGQDCLNCPEASALAHELQKDYGADKVIVVGLHSGPYGRWPSSRVVGLRTKLADTYAQHWGVESQPTALINRRGGLLTRFAWRAAVHEALQTPTSLHLTLRPTAPTATSPGAVHIDVQSSEAFEGKLQVWLVEDHIVAPQRYPEKVELRYVHQHVLRAAVNGTWGEDIALQGQQTLSRSYPLSLDPAWQPRHLRIVAFVYHKGGVEQVATAPLIINP